MRILRAIWRVLCNFVMRLVFGEDELAYCEACGHAHRWKVSQYSEGCNFCPTCWRDITDCINSCDHPEAELEECTDEYGDPSICCKECSGIFSLTDPVFEAEKVELAKLSLKERLEFEDWMRRLDQANREAESPYGKESLWKTTGATAWIDFFRDPSYRDDPKGALYEDLSNA